MKTAHDYIKLLTVDPAKKIAEFAIPDTIAIFGQLLATKDDELIKKVVQNVNPYILNKNAGLTRIFPTTFVEDAYLGEDKEMRENIGQSSTKSTSSLLAAKDFQCSSKSAVNDVYEGTRVNEDEEMRENIGQSSIGQKVALVMHSYFTDLVPYLLKYASNMPEYADIYITTGSEEKAQKLREKVDSSGLNKHKKVEVRVIENRGRDVSALLVGAADLVNKYDLICYVHDKKSSYMLPETVGETWGDELFECNLSSAEYVQNIINEFRQKPHLGLSIAPPPHHAGYFFLLNGNHNWAENYSPTVSLLKTLGAQNAPISRSLPLFAPFGSMFWFRTKAMTKIFNKTWKYTDFDAEPLGLDATISHAIERVWAYLAADLGYYSMIAIPDNYFAAEFGALAHYLHGITPILVKNRVSFGPPKVMSSSLKDLLGGH